MGIEIIGFIAATCTTSAIVPQLIKTVKTKDTSAISLLFTVMLSVGALLWFVYGIMLHNVVIIVSNVMVFLLISVILGYKVMNIITKKDKI